MDAWILRFVILIFGLVLLATIYYTGAPRNQKARTVKPRKGDRLEPSVGDTTAAAQDGLDPELRSALQDLGREIEKSRAEPEELAITLDLLHPQDEPRPATAVPADTPVEAPESSPETVINLPRAMPGVRMHERIDRIVTLLVVPAEGEYFSGPDIVVAAEKTGLVFGDLGIFHRLVDGRPEQGPIFSVADRMKPGSFDMAKIHSLRSTGLSLFMTLPGPLSALNAWETMQPAAQRLAELLGGEVRDDERNTLSRSRIQFMRDELRQFDREQERNLIKKPW
jgi:cell division protein ZipA